MQFRKGPLSAALLSVCVVLCVLAVPTSGVAAGTLSCPHWYIVVDDAGYADWMIMQYPGQTPHENLSGEWAAAVQYDGIATTGGESMWLTPYFICPYFVTNSTFWTVVPLSSWDDGLNPTVGLDTGYSAISNGVLGIEISYVMHDTGTGVACGLNPGGLGPAPPVPSGQYVLEVTYDVTNISADPLSNVDFFQFLHSHPNDNYGPSNHAVYDPTPYPTGAMPEYHYDITQYGASLWNPPGSDITGFSSAVPPDAWGIGAFPGHGSEPTVGLHLDIYADSLPLTLFGGPDEIAGAMEWHIGTLLPGESFTRSVLLYNGFACPEIPPAPPVSPITIDIKPGSCPNSINLSAMGTVAVAVLADPLCTYSPGDLDLSTVTFAGAPIATRPNGTYLAAWEDVNDDGEADLVLHFRISDLQLGPDDEVGVLLGSTLGGDPVGGLDSVRPLLNEPAGP